MCCIESLTLKKLFEAIICQVSFYLKYHFYFFIFFNLKARTLLWGEWTWRVDPIMQLR